MGDYADKVPMLVAASVDETTSDPVPLNNTRQHWHGVEFAVGVTSGVVIVETAPTRNFAGAWKELLSVDASANMQDDITFPGLGGFVRHRISTVVAGGGSPSVSSWCKRIQIGW